MIDAVSEFLSKKKNVADEYREIIEGMLNNFDNPYEYAYDTLTGILEYIEERGDVTEGQITAIKNIRANPSYNE